MNNAPEFFIDFLRAEVRYQARVAAQSTIGSLTHSIAVARFEEAVEKLEEALDENR